MEYNHRNDVCLEPQKTQKHVALQNAALDSGNFISVFFCAFCGQRSGVLTAECEETLRCKTAALDFVNFISAFFCAFCGQRSGVLTAECAETLRCKTAALGFGRYIGISVLSVVNNFLRISAFSAVKQK